MIDRIVSNAFGFTRCEDYILNGNGRWPKRQIFKIDGFVYDSKGQKLRKWYVDITQMRTTSNTRISKRFDAPPEWISPTKVLDIEYLSKVTTKFGEKWRKIHDNLWIGIQRLFESKIIPIKYSDTDNDLGNFRATILDIRPHSGGEYMNWVDPDELLGKEKNQKQFSYGSSTIDIREFKEGTKVDAAAYDTIRKFEKISMNLLMKQQTFRSLLLSAIEMRIIRESDSIFGKKFYDNAYTNTSDCRFDGNPHRVFEILCQSVKYTYHVWYNIEEERLCMKLIDSSIRSKKSIVIEV